MRIVVASDHGGFALKKQLVEYLKSEGYDVADVGCPDESSVDYPDYAEKAVLRYRNNDCDFIILICGTGVGISIAANKFRGIRCALCVNEYEAEMTRRHNNANALAMGGRVLGIELAKSIVKKFLSTQFEGERHQRRLDKISAIEERE